MGLGPAGAVRLARKITIGEAQACGALALLISCAAAPVASGGCRHASELTLKLAIALWGEDRRLDDLRLRCSLCGSRQFEVRPKYDHGLGR